MYETGIEQARHGLGEIVDRARFTGEPTLITRNGKPVAVVVNADWHAKALKALAFVRADDFVQDRHADLDPNADEANEEAPAGAMIAKSVSVSSPEETGK